MMTRLLASAAACLALTLFAAPAAFAVPAVSGIAPIVMDGDCGGCKGKEKADEKPSTTSVRAEMGKDCDGCKGKEKGDKKPEASAVAGVIAPVAMGDCGSCKGKEKADEKPSTSSARADMGKDCDGCKGKEKGDDKPATS
ncbi:MAG: hypothetical protein AAGF84_08840 [Planctomycetota bacterium]